VETLFRRYQWIVDIVVVAICAGLAAHAAARLAGGRHEYLDLLEGSDPGRPAAVPDDPEVAVNGLDVRRPDSALEAYIEFRGANHLSIALERGGRRMIIECAIR